MIWQVREDGGLVLLSILGLSFVGWSLLLSKWQRLKQEEQAYTAWKQATEADQQPAALLEHCQRFPCIAARAAAFALHSGAIQRDFRAHLTAYLGGEAGPLRSRLGMLGGIAATLPSLGLLGTVWGISQSFRAIAWQAGDPQALAGGITQALITTEAGLLTAVPILLGTVALRARIERHLQLADLAARRWWRTSHASPETA